MDRPQIRRGVDDRWLMAVLTGLLLSLFGCLAGTTSNIGTKKPTRPAAATIEGLAFGACQSRDRIAADKLDALATDIESGALKYDAPLQERVIAINDEAANNADAVKLAKLLATKLQPGETFDSMSAAKALRELAAGRRRASQ